MREVLFGGRRILIGRARHIQDGPRVVSLNVSGVTTLGSAREAKDLAEALAAAARELLPSTDQSPAAGAG